MFKPPTGGVQRRPEDRQILTFLPPWGDGHSVLWPKHQRGDIPLSGTKAGEIWLVLCQLTTLSLCPLSEPGVGRICTVLLGLSYDDP